MNARFKGVPPAFQAADITNEVLGAVDIAFCAEGSSVHVSLDEESGAVTASEDARAAASISVERYQCNLMTMRCQWLPSTFGVREGGGSTSKAAKGLPATDPNDQLARPKNQWVELGAVRLNVSLADGTRVTVKTHFMAALQRTVDCALYAEWKAAAAACAHLLQGTAPAEQQQEWGLILALPPPEQQFHFAEVLLTRLPYTQERVHGLLGQRAADVRPADSRGRGMAAVSVSTNGAAGAAHPVGVTREGGEPHVALSAAPTLGFGPQGEGAIEGVYHEYKVPTLDAHRASFTYARFVC